MEYSIVIPIYNESQSLDELQARIRKVFMSLGKGEEFEILFIDDGSTDDTKKILTKLSFEKTHIKTIRLRRNCGKSFALAAGFFHAAGNFIFTMDGDLQDQPEEIPKFIEKMGEGYDLVTGWKQKRKDGMIRVMGSRIFNGMVSFLGGIRIHDFNCGFKLYKRDVVRKILIYGQYHRFIPLLAHFAGFKVGEVRVQHELRAYGKSRYPAFRYQGFFDIFSILFIYKYRFSPLYFFGMLGMLLMIPSGIIIFIFLLIIIAYFMGLITNPYISFDRPTLALSVAIFTMGFNIFIIGLVCDFILHHQSTRAISESFERMIDEIL